MDDLALYLPIMRAWPRYRDQREWLEANDRFRRDVVDRLRAEGALRGGEIPDTSQVSWKSTGWTNDRNVTQMLEFLSMRGEVAVSRREGRDRVWDLAERVYPADVVELSDDDAAQQRAQRRLGYLGRRATQSGETARRAVRRGRCGGGGEIAGVEGVWRVDPALLADVDDFVPRTALLSPFDRLVFDRTRARDLFGFEYVVEMYKPAAQRRWGYFALPILHGDRTRREARCDGRPQGGRAAAWPRSTKISAFTSEVTDAVHAEIRELAAWLGVEVTGMPGG